MAQFCPDEAAEGEFLWGGRRRVSGWREALETGYSLHFGALPDLGDRFRYTISSGVNVINSSPPCS